MMDRSVENEEENQEEEELIREGNERSKQAKVMVEKGSSQYAKKERKRKKRRKLKKVKEKRNAKK